MCSTPNHRLCHLWTLPSLLSWNAWLFPSLCDLEVNPLTCISWGLSWQLRTCALSCFSVRCLASSFPLSTPMQRWGPVPTASLQPHYRPGASLWTTGSMWDGHRKQGRAREDPGPLRRWEPVGVAMAQVCVELEFKTWLFHSLAMWPWTSYLHYIILHFLICKVGWW